eukprot:gene59912-81968_t
MNARRRRTVIPTSNDGILTVCKDGRFAIVHLTWGQGPGNAEYPHTVIYNSANELNDALWRDAVWQGFVDDFDPNDPRLLVRANGRTVATTNYHRSAAFRPRLQSVRIVRSASKLETMATIVLPDVAEVISPMVFSIPIQLLAYHTAVFMGTDVDQPRNLAKSVTVELRHCANHPNLRSAQPWPVMTDNPDRISIATRLRNNFL